MKSRRTEEEFMEELAALFLAQGVSALTVADIAARLRCSRRRIYALAATKEELFLLVARRLFDILVREGHEVVKGESDLSVAITAYLGVGARASARISVAYLADLDASEKGRQLFDDYQLARLRGMEHLIDEGVARGHFASHNSRLVAESLLGAAQRLRRPRFLAEAGLTLEQAFQELYTLVLDGLLVKGPRTATEPAAGQGLDAPVGLAGHAAPVWPGSQAGGAAEQVERILEKMTTR